MTAASMHARQLRRGLREAKWHADRPLGNALNEEVIVRGETTIALIRRRDAPLSRRTGVWRDPSGTAMVAVGPIASREIS